MSPIKEISDEDFRPIIEKQKKWVAENFMQNLLEGLRPLGFELSDIEPNTESINDRLSHILARISIADGVSGEEYSCYVQAAEEVRLDKSKLFASAGYDRINIGMYTRDSLVHLCIHALQPIWVKHLHTPESNIPPLSLHEGGAEALSNLIQRKFTGKVTHQGELVALSAELFSTGVQSRKLRRDFLTYNLIGFKFQENVVSEKSDVECIMGEFVELEKKFIGDEKLPTAARKMLENNTLDHAGLDFLAAITYTQGMSEVIRRQNAKANLVMMLDGKMGKGSFGLGL